MAIRRPLFFSSLVIVIASLALSMTSEQAHSDQGPDDKIIRAAHWPVLSKMKLEKIRPHQRTLVGRYLVKRDAKPVLSDLYKYNDKLHFLLPHEVLTLPLKLPILVSRDANTILQYGDSLSRMHPVRTNLFWIGRSGEIVKQVQNRYAGKALVNMASDGTTAVAGNDFFAAHEKKTDKIFTRIAMGYGSEVHLDVYDPKGNRLWAQNVKEDRNVLNLRALPGGKYVLLQTASGENRLKDHQLQLFDRSGAGKPFGKDFGIIQKIAVLGEGRWAFVQGSSGHGIVALPEGSSLWINKENVRMISPNAVALGGDSDELLLMTGDRKDRTQPLYKWTLRIINLHTGDQRWQTTLDKAYPSTWGPVFLDIQSNTAKILAGGETIKVRLPRAN